MTNPSNALVLAGRENDMVYTPGHIGNHIPTDLAELSRYAELFVQSGYFTDSRQVASAAVKIMRGAELGLTPFAAMDGLHIIQGKVCVSAGVMTALIDSSPDHDYMILEVEDDTKKCAIEFFVRNAGGQMVRKGVSTFTLDEARKAGLIKPGSNWEKWPADMLFARAMSRGFRRFCSRLANGATPYTPEEIRSGDIIDAQYAEPVAAHTKPQQQPQPVQSEKKPAPTAEEKEAKKAVSSMRAAAAGKAKTLLHAEQITSSQLTALCANMTSVELNADSPIEAWQAFDAVLAGLIEMVEKAGFEFGTDEWHRAVSRAVGFHCESLSGLALNDWKNLFLWLETGVIPEHPEPSEEPADEDEAL